MAKRVELDITKIEHFLYDMTGCVKCKGCLWVDHIYMPGIRFSRRCPSATRYLYDSYGAYGKMRIGLGYLEKRLSSSDTLLKLFYACPLCGACDVGCKRNLDLEIGLTLEAVRVQLVKDGVGPMPAHREVAESVERQHNIFGYPHEKRGDWIPETLRPNREAKVLYFAGCYSSYLQTEIARATVRILEASGTPFQIEIDEEHLLAVVEPGVIYSQLQAEALRKGLYVLVGGGGGQVSVIANMINDGTSPHSYRFGLAQRRILGTEIVLPDGDLLRLGSLALGEDPFWGEGPGPDLRGLLRGGTGWRGSLGIVTKMAIKLMPFQPEPLQPEGLSPHTALKLPQRRVKWVNIRMPDRASLIRAAYEIGKAEIGAAVMRVPLFWRAVAKARNKEEFWKFWSEMSEKTVENFHLLRVLLVAYGSDDQMDYEERVLYDIVNELGGEVQRTKQTDESWFKNADSAGMWLMCGSYLSVDYISETLDHAISYGAMMAHLKEDFTPPLMADYGERGWFQCMEMGHQGYSEYLIYWDPEEDRKRADQFYLLSLKEAMQKGFYTVLLGPNQPLFLTGPAYGPNYHQWLLAMKNEFDPKWLCHPPLPLAHDRFVEETEWMKSLKDWEAPSLKEGPSHLRMRKRLTTG